MEGSIEEHTLLHYYLKPMKETVLFAIQTGVVLLADFYFYLECLKLRRGRESVQI